MSKQITKELVVFLMASLILTSIFFIFRAKEHKDEEIIGNKKMEEVKEMWNDLDEQFLASSEQDGDFLDKHIELMEKKIDDDEVFRALLRIKLFQWIMQSEQYYYKKHNGSADDYDDINGDAHLEEKDGGRDELDGLILNRLFSEELRSQYRGNHESIKQWTYTFESVTRLLLYKELSQSLKEKWTLPEAQQKEIEALRDHFISKALDGSSSRVPSSFHAWEIILYLSFAVFFLSTLVTICSWFVARLITASYLQDLISGKPRLANLKLKVLPYIFAIPAFALASLFAYTPIIEPQVIKALLVFLVMVVSGGLSFELTLKYMDQGRLEYAKPYARYLALNKRGRSKKSFLGLIKNIHIPRRGKTLRKSPGILPFLITGADYQLNEHIRRRMSVIVDSYTLAGLILSFNIFENKPDLVNMLTGAAGSYGASVNTIYMVEAILIGIFASKLLFIVSEAHQFPQR